MNSSGYSGPVRKQISQLPQKNNEDYDKAKKILIEDLPEKSFIVFPPNVLPDTSDLRSPVFTVDRSFTTNPVQSHEQDSLAALTSLLSRRIENSTNPLLEIKENPQDHPEKEFIDFAQSPRNLKSVPRDRGVRPPPSYKNLNPFLTDDGFETGDATEDFIESI